MRLVKLTVMANLLLAPSLAFAQTSKVIIGGVDQRVPPIENEYLARQVTGAVRAMAHADALLALEKQDHQDAEDRATATKAWLDQSWNEMEYWRAYAGFKSEAIKAE